MSRPSRYTRPKFGVWSPVITLNSVVLPAPLGPISPVTRPAPASRSTPDSAITPPKWTSTPSTRNTDRFLHLLGLGLRRHHLGINASRLRTSRVQPADLGAQRREPAGPAVGV